MMMVDVCMQRASGSGVEGLWVAFSHHNKHEVAATPFSELTADEGLDTDVER